jgi:two-component system response regulator YesN
MKHCGALKKGKKGMDRKLEVVLVDDEEQITELLETYLLFSAQGISVHSFNDSIMAKEFIAGNPVDVLITDYKMPLLSGLELMESAPLQVRKIVISGYVSDIAEERLQKLNATFLEKPVPLRALAKIIAEQQEKVCHAF